MPQANQSIIPVRSQPSDKSEMVTQILFGEEYTHIEEQEKWVKIKISFDGYEGWIDKKQTNNNPISPIKSIIVSPTAHIISNEEKHLVSIGSLVDFTMERQGQTSTGEQDPVTIAKMYLNTPYLWGGKSIFGIDCSGLTQQVYKLAKIQLPRDAHQQAQIGEEISYSKRQAKDLAFFGEQDKITHVGIIISKNQIIHASGKVRIDTINKEGIIHSDTKEQTHKLKIIKRVK